MTVLDWMLDLNLAGTELISVAPLGFRILCIFPGLIPMSPCLSIFPGLSPLGAMHSGSFLSFLSKLGLLRALLFRSWFRQNSNTLICCLSHLSPGPVWFSRFGLVSASLSQVCSQIDYGLPLCSPLLFRSHSCDRVPSSSLLSLSQVWFLNGILPETDMDSLQLMWVVLDLHWCCCCRVHWVGGW